jgi:hypothetical protein
MKTYQKIIYWFMLVILAVAITTDIVNHDYKSTNWKVNTLLWFGAAWIAELRCIKLQKVIDEVNQYVNKNLDDIQEKN